MATNQSRVDHRQLNALFALGQLGARSDDELLEWFDSNQTRAQAAFEELVARHGGVVHDVCRRILRDPNDVDDAFQATFLILARRAGGIRDRASLGGWLHRVALRVALRLNAEAVRRRNVERQVAAARAHERACEDLARHEVQTSIHQELDRLPAAYRAAVIACHLEGLTHEEAANRLGWPVGTVRSRLARGRDRLRGRLLRRGLAPGVASGALATGAEAAPAVLQARAVLAMSSQIAGPELFSVVPARLMLLAQEAVRPGSLTMLKLGAIVALTLAVAAGLSPFWKTPMPRPIAVVEPQGEPPANIGRLTGTVLNMNRRPVAGATVVAGVSSGGPNHQITTTDEHGRFSFAWEAGARDPNDVVAYKEGFAPVSTFRISRGQLEKRQVWFTELILPPTAAFTGKVQDGSGRPIAGARARLLYTKTQAFDLNAIASNVVQGTPLESLFMAVSDEQGIIRFPSVPAPLSVMVEVRHDGHGDLIAECPGFHWGYMFAGDGAPPVPLRLFPEARVAGRVSTRIPGVSIAGLKIGLQSTTSMAFWREARTDDEGRFEFKGLPRGEFDVYPYDHPGDGPWTYRAIDALSLRPGATSQAAIELIEGCLVEGQVIDVDTKRPVPGALVDVFGPVRPRRSVSMLSAKTDEEGRYRLRLPLGPNRLTARVARSMAGTADISFKIPANAKSPTIPLLKLGEVPPKEPTPYDVIDP